MYFGHGELKYCKTTTWEEVHIFLFEEHFLYRNDTRFCSPASMGILKHREVRGRLVLGPLWFGALVPHQRRSRQCQMSRSSENWPQGVSEKNLLWFGPSLPPIISFNAKGVLSTAVF